uniref:Fibronectin type III domain-containing protein n=1 Tax=Desulfovibrio sp. U5L TaxID=596152 RepID=I2Q588_9BACT
MASKESLKTEEQAYMSPGNENVSDMRRLLTTLDNVFSTFREQLQSVESRPFTGNAEIAVGVFNDIVAGLKFKSFPQAITIVARELSPTEVELTWTDVANNADAYRVERCQGHNCQDLDEIARLPPTARSFLDTDLVTNNPYRYRVVVLNARGKAPSRIVDITPTPRRD